MQEKDLCVAAIAVVAPFATIAVNAMVFTSSRGYQLWSGFVVT